MKYFATFHVNSLYTTEVEAASLEKARELAEQQFSEADFGEVKETDGYIIRIEDENDNVLEEA